MLPIVKARNPVSRRSRGVLLFGPVFFYDLVRSGRRGEPVGHRILYAFVLLALLLTVYWTWFPFWNYEQLLQNRYLSLRERASFANSFFVSFTMAQFAMIFFITPLYTATAITEQKERGTLDFLFITDLTDREIILGTLGARLVKLLLLLLTGLPVLSLLEMLGGVDPRQVVSAFVATVLLTISVGSMSMLVSVVARTSLGAVITAYLSALILCGLTPCFPFLHTGVSFTIWLISLLGFTFAHGLVTFLCCRSAVAGLRPVALNQVESSKGSRQAVPQPVATRRVAATGQGVPSAGKTVARVPQVGPYVPSQAGSNSTSGEPSSRPPIGADALLWKEIHAASRFGVGEIRLGRLQVMVLVVAVLVYVVAGINARPNRGHPGQVLQDSVRILGMYLGFIFLVIIALSASSRISREREHRTWDSLRTLPVSLHQILFAKWLGSIWSIGSLWYVLAGLWALTVLVGGMSLFALPMLVAAMMVYAAFVACVGLWFSAMSGSTMRAGLFTLLAVLLFLAAPGSFTLPTNRSLRASSGEELEQWGSLIWRFGLSPPTTLWVLSFRAADLLNRGQHVSSVPRLFAAVAGLHIYLGTTLLLWLTTCARLRRR